MAARREETRPRAALNWTLSGDAMRPKEAPWGFIGQNPVQIVLAPGQSRLVKLGIAANVPLMLFPMRSHMDEVFAVDGKQWPIIVPMGDEIAVIVKNTSAHMALGVDDKEPLVAIHPLVFSGDTDVT